MTDTKPWPPQTESDLKAADESGLLDEGGQRLELKRELPKGQTANIELARDLASLAVDGGLLIVGVRDTKDRPPTFHPIPLKGMPERIDQVALARCDPPLLVRTYPIPSENDPSVGYLVVEVPPSATPPHMVDGKYWGRGDVTKRALPDREVSELLDKRRSRDLVARQALDEYTQRDPVQEPGLRRTARLFVVVKPMATRTTQLLDALNDTDQRTELTSVVFGWDYPTDYAPNLRSAYALGTRSDGWGFSSFEEVATGRVVPESEAEKLDSRILEVEVAEDGTVRLLSSRVTDDLQAGTVIFDKLVAGNTLTAISIAARVADRMSYGGLWSIGVSLVGPLRGRVAWSIVEGMGYARSRYMEDSYTEYASTSTLEMQSSPGSVTMRVVGRFLRTLGTDRSTKILRTLGLDTPSS